MKSKLHKITIEEGFMLTSKKNITYSDNSKKPNSTLLFIIGQQPLIYEKVIKCSNLAIYSRRDFPQQNK